MNTDPTEFARKLYQEMEAFYATLPLAPKTRLGFKILYSPPVANPPLLFLGYQPGGNLVDCERERASGAEFGWPRDSEYVTQSWTLARNLRPMFGVSLLRQSAAANAIFVRSPNVETYRRSVEKTVRDAISQFCIPRIRDFVQVTKPKLVVVIGMDTLALFGGGRDDLVNGKGRCLSKVGAIANRPAIGVLHLSGAQVANVDRQRIADRILALAEVGTTI